MSDPQAWGERRRRREEERRRASEAAGQDAGDGDGAVVPGAPASQPPDDGGPRPADPAGQIPRARRPVVRPPTMSQRPGAPAPRAPSSPSRAAEPAAATRPAPPPRGRPTAAVLPTDDPRPGSRRWLLGLAAVLVLALLAGGIVWALGRDSGTDDGPVAAGDPATRTALVALEQDGVLTGASLLSVGESETTAMLLPSKLLVDVAGGGRVPLAESVSVSDDAPGNAVADALDLRVDGTWLLSAVGLSQLVDATGGVAVDVDTEVGVGDVLLAPGADQRLTGAQAAAYATFLGAGEAEAMRLARQERVLARLIAALPTDAAQVATTLAAAGDASRSTVPDGGLEDLLATVAAHAAAGAYGASVLPVTDIATGGEEVLYGVDAQAAGEILAARFAGAQREGAQDAVRVLVQNGVGTPGLGDDARGRLVEAGFRFVGGGNAESLGRETSAVLVPSSSDSDREAGLGVAETLGLPAEVVAVGQEAPTMADVVVVLGADFAQVAGRAP